MRKLSLLAAGAALGLAAPAMATVSVWSTGTGANGHGYEFVTTGSAITWTAAQAAAASLTYNGQNGYLATITSADENNFLLSVSSGLGWLGGTDAGHEGIWQWADGPEIGQTFYLAGAPSQPGYSNWTPGEPNNCCGGENYLQTNFSNSSGFWNDADPSTVSTFGYYVEFDAPAPEVASWAIMAGGFGLIGATLRRRGRIKVGFA